MKARWTLVALLAVAPAAWGRDGIMGSESCVAVASVTAGASGRAQSESVRASVALGLPAEARVAQSAGYVLRAGVVGRAASLDTPGPLVLGTTPPAGPKLGGHDVRVLGFGLAAPGGGPPHVVFGGVPVFDAELAASTHVDVVAPGGGNVFGNPLGSTAVTVQHALGSGTNDTAHDYLPALVRGSSAPVGGELVVELRAAAPGFLHQLFWGTSVPGIAVPIAPLEGALELIGSLNPLTPLAQASTTTARHRIPIPPAPALAGHVVELQSAILTSPAPLAGSFTNRIEVLLGP